MEALIGCGLCAATLARQPIIFLKTGFSGFQTCVLQEAIGPASWRAARSETVLFRRRLHLTSHLYIVRRTCSKYILYYRVFSTILQSRSSFGWLLVLVLTRTWLHNCTCRQSFLVLDQFSDIVRSTPIYTAIYTKCNNKHKTNPSTAYRVVNKSSYWILLPILRTESMESLILIKLRPRASLDKRNMPLIRGTSVSRLYPIHDPT